MNIIIDVDNKNSLLLLGTSLSFYFLLNELFIFHCHVQKQQDHLLYVYNEIVQHYWLVCSWQSRTYNYLGLYIVLLM